MNRGCPGGTSPSVPAGQVRPSRRDTRVRPLFPTRPDPTRT
nr:MAG TPA: hypothetical protein [Caudoviricetes sp.]